jgi:hypothetical protein
MQIGQAYRYIEINKYNDVNGISPKLLSCTLGGKFINQERVCYDNKRT